MNGLVGQLHTAKCEEQKDWKLKTEENVSYFCSAEFLFLSHGITKCAVVCLQQFAVLLTGLIQHVVSLVMSICAIKTQVGL